MFQASPVSPTHRLFSRSPWRCLCFQLYSKIRPCLSLWFCGSVVLCACVCLCVCVWMDVWRVFGFIETGVSAGDASLSDESAGRTCPTGRTRPAARRLHVSLVNTQQGGCRLLSGSHQTARRTGNTSIEEEREEELFG